MMGTTPGGLLGDLGDDDQAVRHDEGDCLWKASVGRAEFLSNSTTPKPSLGSLGGIVHCEAAAVHLASEPTVPCKTVAPKASVGPKMVFVV